jgi:hypothetical protein
MTEPQPDPAAGGSELAVSTAQDLNQTLGGILKELVRLRKYGRRNRLYIALDVLATVIATAATIVAFNATSSAHTTETLAAQNRAAVIISCRAVNRHAAADNAVEQTLVALAAKAPRLPRQTAAQRAQAARNLAVFEAKLKAEYAPQDCSALFSGKPR